VRAWSLTSKERIKLNGRKCNDKGRWSMQTERPLWLDRRLGDTEPRRSLSAYFITWATMLHSINSSSLTSINISDETFWILSFDYLVAYKIISHADYWVVLKTAHSHSYFWFFSRWENGHEHVNITQNKKTQNTHFF